MSDDATPEALPPVEGEAVSASTDGLAAGGGSPRRRHPFYLRGRRLRMPTSKRGLFALLMVIGSLGFVSIFAGVSMIHWTETADFCGRCHTMTPELMAYQSGAHAEVTCGECHVEPGIAGWVKAKVNGSRQLVEIILGTYPSPILPPEHSELPKASDTCMECHDVEREALAVLKTRTQFSEDEANSRQFVGLLVRPGGGDVFNVERSVHWHVIRNVTYTTPDENAASIDYVEAAMPDGSVRQYIAQDRIGIVEDVAPDIEELKATERTVTVTCYDCHNRAGHDVANPRTGLDYALSTGVIDATLPYIKREGMRILWSSYPDEATADTETDKLSDFYTANYPDVAQGKAAQIEEAIAQIKVLYRLTATPAMKVTAATYPNHLGHTDFPGCFRCHDGGHFLVENGVATKQTIPSTCDTCHTFPQIGPAVASLPLGEPPSTHNDSLWVFDHKNVASELDPGKQSCGECHARDYCVNCHATGAVSVEHATMTTNHAQVIRDQGNNSCAYCHLPVFCARCHKEPVLPLTTPFSHGSGTTEGQVEDLPTGVSWPLTPRG
jgi:nitrate/TMAO reductase-like tetraheme cytochrome c subunit